MLEVKKISVSYFGVPVIREVSFKVEEGQMVSIVGSNGAGKSTLLKTISGLLRPLSGEIAFLGKRIDTVPPYEITSAGISHIPEGRKVFAKLSVLDNLLVGAHTRTSRPEVAQTLEEILDLFPILRERKTQKGETLSGGEQQMLAIGRGLMVDPEMLLFDEPSLGLAPIIVETIFALIQKIRDFGKTILLIEQNANMALAIADRGYVMETGNIILSGTAKELANNPSVASAYLGI